MCYPVCGMMIVKEPLLLIGKSSPCGGSGFPFSFYIYPTPYNRKENVLSASLNKNVSWNQKKCSNCDYNPFRAPSTSISCTVSKVSSGGDRDGRTHQNYCSWGKHPLRFHPVWSCWFVLEPVSCCRGEFLLPLIRVKLSMTSPNARRRR